MAFIGPGTGRTGGHLALGANMQGLDPILQRQSGNAEEQLINYAQQLEATKMGWQAVRLHLSELHQVNRRDYNIRIALAGLDDLISRRDGRLFVLDNNDFVMLVKGAKVSEVDEAVFQIKFLFQDDPLTKRDDAFSTWYDLSIGHRDLMRTARRLLQEKMERRGGGGETDGFAEIEPIDPTTLHKFQTAIESLDLSAYMRRQPVCVIIGDNHPEPVFEEIYVRIADLQRPLMPNVNLFGNRWLFQHLTQTLDLRVLTLLARRPSQFLAGPASLNLNVDTLLSQAFLAFDAVLKGDAQQSIVLELQAFDVFADVKAFEFAREFVRRKGYRICLDGLTARSFGLFDREQLGFDLFKLFWDESLQMGDTDALAGAIKAAGIGRVILAHCDDERAIDHGHALGISMFQGRYVDQVLAPGSRPRN